MLTKTVTRADIVACARTFLGTPFVHQGRLKGRSLDCVGLGICVAEYLGLVDRAGEPITCEKYPAHYSRQPVGNALHEACQAHLIQKPMESLEPGDVLTMCVPDDPTHLAIVSDLPRLGLGIIHAYEGAGRVVEAILDERWRRRIVGAFSFPGVY